VLLGLAVLISLQMESVGGAWKFLLTFVSGAGLTWIVRWFWWRANAWTEFSGMITSGVMATAIQLVRPDWLYSYKLLLTVGVTTVVWVTVTYLTPPVDEERLAGFVRTIRPGSPGWNRIYRRHGIEPTPFLGQALVLCGLGVVGLFSLNFGVGSLLLCRPGQGVALLALSAVVFGLLAWRMRRSATLARARETQ